MEGPLGGQLPEAQGELRSPCSLGVSAPTLASRLQARGTANFACFRPLGMQQFVAQPLETGGEQWFLYLAFNFSTFLKEKMS